MQRAQKDGTAETEEFQKTMFEKGMATFWNLGKMEVEGTVKAVVEKVIKDNTISKVCF